jgi:uncharacterized protein YecE (DUF72 family)
VSARGGRGRRPIAARECAPALSRPGSRVHVGTSGWSYTDWEECFYPPEVRGAERLSYYATQFDTVELNVSFYRVPTPPMIAAWNARLHAGFRLAAKGTRLATHIRRLADVDEVLRFFYGRVLAIERVAIVLWQLPPTLRKDLPRLAAFLAALPRAVRHAVEFRDASWWDDEVAALLAAHGAAFVAVSHPELPDALLPTADVLYVRFHGLGTRKYDYEYSQAELEPWIERIAERLGGRELYAYFNNDYRCQAIRNARTFRALLDARLAREPAAARSNPGRRAT